MKFWNKIVGLFAHSARREEEGGQSPKAVARSGEWRVSAIGRRDGGCPYCGFVPDKPPKRASKCRSCGKRGRVRSRKDEPDFGRVSEVEGFFLEALYSYQLFPFNAAGNEEHTFLKSEHEARAERLMFSLRRENGTASVADLVWRAMVGNFERYVARSKFGSAAMQKTMMAELLLLEGKAGHAINPICEAHFYHIFGACYQYAEMKAQLAGFEPSIGDPIQSIRSRDSWVVPPHALHVMQEVLDAANADFDLVSERYAKVYLPAASKLYGLQLADCTNLLRHQLSDRG